MNNTNKFLSLSWFKDKIETATERAVENVVVNKLNALMEEEETVPLEKEGNDLDIESNYVPPYINLKLIGDSLIIVLNDGTILNKPNASKDDFEAANKAKTVQEILNIISSEEIKQERAILEIEIKKVEKLHEGIELLKQLEDFDVRDSSVYLKGINRSMPQLLVERFINIANSFSRIHNNETLFILMNSDIEYQSLKKFWLKCCLNPNAQSAEDLYTFLTKHNFKIDKHGNFFAYRNVVSRETKNKELVEFISNAYTKVKAVWHRNPINYRIVDLGEKNYKLEKTTDIPAGSIIGNLSTLYLDLPSLQENSYTSAHTGKEDYRIGSVISMPRNEGDDNNNVSCSKGFHAASKAYDYSSFGDQSILIIINPVDVLSVPLNEEGKLRTCRWFFATTLSKEEKYILDDESYDVTELGNIFEEKCNENLEKYVQKSFAEEIQRHTFNIPTLSNKQLKTIVSSLEKMKETISNRIQKI